jgi:hypothetical protein
MKRRGFDFDISSIPSTFVIRTLSFAEGKFIGLRCEVQNRRSWSVWLQQVAHLYSLGLEIFCIVRIGFAANRHLFDHLNAVTLKTNDFLRIIR